MQQITKQLTDVVIRLTGDSGDGMQLAGTQLTQASAQEGNDIQTFPDFPAEIRAPAGTLAGVSGFQLHFSEQAIHTPGDQLDVLVAMNPAALKTNLADLAEDGNLLLNENNFNERELKKAAYTSNPLSDHSLDKYQVITIPMTDLTVKAVSGMGLSHSSAKLCKNMYALGIVCWLYSRPVAQILVWLEQKFASKPELIKANQAALTAGFNYADTMEIFSERYQVKHAPLPVGTYRQITGIEAMALAVATVAMKSQRPTLLSGYPITPASNLLHSLAHYEHAGVSIFQAEDEIAAMCATIGAAYGGSMALTCTSGPGLDLKSEAIGLAVMVELPMVIIDIQRAGPSTGMPTKLEQTDLMTAVYGRHGEAPLPVLAAASPSDCFNTVLEAFQIAIKHMTPVVVLSDGALANGAEPWLIPAIEQLPEFKPQFADEATRLYQRDPQTQTKPWTIPGVAGLEHRIGGLEKDYATGNISYDAANHEKMVAMRAEKIKAVAQSYTPLTTLGAEQGEVLVIGWGSTYGVILTAVESLQQQGHAISAVHLRYLNPFPADLKKLLAGFKKILVVELNSGQLCRLLRAEFLIDAQTVNKISGKPFLVGELVEQLLTYLEPVS